MFVLYYYSVILYKLFHFSKSFRYFSPKVLFFCLFPPFYNKWWRLRHFLKTGDDAGILVGSAPSESARGGFLSPRLVLFPDLSAPHEMKAATERSFFLCWLEEPATTGIGDECGRECNALIFRHINRMLEREALQEDKQALLGFQTGVSWGVSRPWLEVLVGLGWKC